MRNFWALTAAFCGTAFISTSAFADKATPAESPYVAGQMLVKMPQVNPTTLGKLSRSGLMPRGSEMLNRIGNSNWTLWSINPKANPLEVARTLNRGSGLHAEPVTRVKAKLVTPNDGDWNVFEDDDECVLILNEDELFDPFLRLWALDDVSAFNAWSQWPNTWYNAVTKDRKAPLIAVIDTGADMEHPDFINAGGTTSNITGGGQLDHSLSHRFRFGGIDSTSSSNDGNGHGTHVLGTALAAGNNGSFNGHGHIGTGYNSIGMVLGALEANGSGTDSDVAAAIFYAVDQGADVINMSLGTESFSYILQDAVTYATQKGCFVVAATNEIGSPSGTLPRNYPAGCSSAFGVTAAGPGQFAPVSYTTIGDYYDMAAPSGDYGYDIYGNFLIVFAWSTMPRGPFTLQNTLYIPTIKPEYTQIIGTSMATPHVAGAAGLWLGQQNLRQTSGYTPQRVARALQQTAAGTTSPTEGWDYQAGFGHLDMESLMTNTTRNATSGSVEGIVYKNGATFNDARIEARKGTSLVVTTAVTRGLYRFEALSPGEWTITAKTGEAVGETPKTRKVRITAGAEVTGFDFWNGGNIYDTTAPTVARFELASAPTANSVSIKHWGYDTETGIEKFTYQIGTTQGGAGIKAVTEGYTDSDTLSITSLNLTAGTTYWVRGVFTNGNGLTRTVDFPFQIGGTLRTISGQVQLQDWVQHHNGRLGSIQVRDTSGNVLATHPLVIDRFGNFTFKTNRAGNLDVAVKIWHWLSKKQTVTTTNATGLIYSLKNGDAMEDNVVDLSDYTAVAIAFNADPSSPNWNVNADLNGDNIVDLTDYTITAANFNQIGE